MPFVPTPNGIKAEVRVTALGQQCENVFWFFNSTPNPSLTDLQTVADLLYNWWLDEIGPITSSNVTLREIYVTDQSLVDGDAYTYSPSSATNGSNVNEPLPNNVTLCISLRTAKRGRSYRGRSYVIGLTENQVLLNNVTDVAAAAWVAAYDVLVSQSAASGYPLAVASFVNNKVARAQGVLTIINDALVTDTVVDGQRRRLPGRGS